MRTITIAAVMIVLLPATAYAQHQPATLRTDEQKKEDAEINKAYQEVKKGMKSEHAKFDPWHMERPAAGDKTKK